MPEPQILCTPWNWKVLHWKLKNRNATCDEKPTYPLPQPQTQNTAWQSFEEAFWVFFLPFFMTLSRLNLPKSREVGCLHLAVTCWLSGTKCRPPIDLSAPLLCHTGLGSAVTAVSTSSLATAVAHGRTEGGINVRPRHESAAAAGGRSLPPPRANMLVSPWRIGVN